MKLRLLIKLFFIATITVHSQVGIGNTSPSAGLDISSSTTGLLIPRVALTNLTIQAPVLNPQTGNIPESTLVYHNGANSINAGFYYWGGSKWILLTTTESSDWTILGNTGTNPLTNFIGTTDAQDFVVKTNNLERIRVLTTGNVGILETNPINASLEIGGNLIIGNTFTGGTATAQVGGVTIEGRTIIGEDNFYYSVDKFVVYGNTTWTPGNVTNGDNATGLTFAINAYTSNGIGLYAEDNDGGTGLQVSVNDKSLTVGAIGISATEGSGIGTAIIGEVTGTTITATAVGVIGIEATNTGNAMVASGDMQVTGTFTNPSDRKLKKNIKPLKNALHIISKLNPKTYEMRWDEEKYRNVGFAKMTQIGFIAQELEKVLPNLVKNDIIHLNNHIYTKKQLQENPELSKKRSNTEKIKSVNYIQLIPLLTKAIKEQQEQIEDLKQAIEDLKN